MPNLCANCGRPDTLHFGSNPECPNFVATPKIERIRRCVNCGRTYLGHERDNTCIGWLADDGNNGEALALAKSRVVSYHLLDVP